MTISWVRLLRRMSMSLRRFFCTYTENPSIPSAISAVSSSSSLHIFACKDDVWRLIWGGDYRIEVVWIRGMEFLYTSEESPWWCTAAGATDRRWPLSNECSSWLLEQVEDISAYIWLRLWFPLLKESQLFSYLGQCFSDKISVWFMPRRRRVIWDARNSSSASETADAPLD